MTKEWVRVYTPCDVKDGDRIRYYDDDYQLSKRYERYVKYIDNIAVSIDADGNIKDSNIFKRDPVIRWSVIEKLVIRDEAKFQSEDERMIIDIIL